MTTTKQRSHGPENRLGEPYPTPATQRRQAALLAAAERLGVKVEHMPSGAWRLTSRAGLYLLAADLSVVTLADLTLDHPTAHPEARAAGNPHAS